MSNETKVPTFLCNKVFDDDMLSHFMTFYGTCVAKNSKDAIIYINSPGGYVNVLDSMLSIIESSDITFHSVGIGWCASCGLLLLAGCDVRYATDRASIMYHDIGGGSYGHPDQIEEYLERMKEISKRVLNKFADKTKKPLSWWDAEYMKSANRQFWFDAKKAKTLGVVDHIGIPVEKLEQKLTVGI